MLNGKSLVEVSEVAPMAGATCLAMCMESWGVWAAAKHAAKNGVSLNVALKAARIRASAKAKEVKKVDLIEQAGNWLMQVS